MHEANSQNEGTNQDDMTNISKGGSANKQKYKSKTNLQNKPGNHLELKTQEHE